MAKHLDQTEIWNFHPPVATESLEIRIEHEKPELPDDVQKRVDDNWTKFVNARPNAQDNDVAFLVSYNSNGVVVSATVFTAGFRYNRYFNRDDKEMRDIQIANELNFNPLSSWILAVCDKGNYVLFGNKKDFGDRKVSAFGGFSSQNDIQGNKINASLWLERSLRGEMGDMYEAVVGISTIGLNFHPTVGPKGFDGIHIAHLDGSAWELQHYFTANDQFSEQLIPVKANPSSLLDFLGNPDWEPTRSCVAGVFNYIGAIYGRDELVKALAKYELRGAITLFPEPFSGNVRDRILI